MKVKEIMSSEVVTVAEGTSLKEVAEILAERRISGLPVLDDEGFVVGVVSEADILFKERGPSTRKGVFAWLLDRYGYEGQLKLEARVAGEAMTAPAIVIEPQRPVAEAAHVMLERRVNRLPVVDRGKVVGIISIRDLTRWAAEELSAGHEMPDIARSHKALRAASELQKQRRKGVS